MKFKFMSFAAAMAACMTFASCSNDEAVSAQNENLAALSHVSVGINNQQNSRAGITASNFNQATGDVELGLFVFGPNGFDDAYNATDHADNLKAPLNIKYYRGVEGTIEGGDWNEYFVSDEAIILSAKMGNLYSYYPWVDGAINPAAIPVEVLSNQGTGITSGVEDDLNDSMQRDWLYSNVTTVNNETPLNGTVTLKMNHALTMVTFKFIRNTYPGVGKIEKIELYNGDGSKYLATGAATMNIATGAISFVDATNYSNTIFCAPNAELVQVPQDAEGHSELLPHMLVYPQADNIQAGNVMLRIFMDGSKYELQLPATLAGDEANAYNWKAGNNYVYTLKMNGFGFGDSVDGKNDIDVEIIPWKNTAAGTGELNRPVKQ